MRKSLKLIWYTVLALILIWFVNGLIYGTWPFVKVPDEIIWKTVSHPEYGFSIDYPTRWISRKYDEDGIRGIEEAKLQIADRQPRSILAITIYLMEKESPSLEDVTSWEDVRIGSMNRGLSRQGKEHLELIEEWKDEIGGQTNIRRKYDNNSNLIIENVCIARDNDMIIITFQATHGDYLQYKNDFDRIVSSFEPLN